MSTVIVKKDTDFWSWFAGFWEGEGCVTAYKAPNGRVSEFRLHVCQADRKPMDYIKERLGIGRVHFNRPVKREGWNDGGNWYYSVHKRRDIIAVVEKMLPFVRFKHKQLVEFLSVVREAEARRDAHHFWTDSEKELLKEKYPVASQDELVKMFSVPWRTIQVKARRLYLKRRWGMK